jgi:DNA primase
MNREGLGFMEVVSELAQQAGVSIPKHHQGNPDYRSSSERERYEQMYAITASWFQQNLHTAEVGKEARLYLKNRGIDSPVIEEFGIGYAEHQWNGLSIHLEKKGFTQGEVVRSGLVVTKESTGQSRHQRYAYYDRFRDRIMFPIANSRDRIVAFGGRSLNDQGTPKYLNSPETSFFSKGRMLYGLGRARKAASQLDRLFLVEGYFDVIALSQAGVHNVVAPLGTALTSDHVQTIRRLAKTVVLLFDGDTAGVNAALRTLDLFLNTGLTVNVMVLPKGDDPDTFIRRQGVEDFMELESRASPLLDFAVTTCLDQYQGDSVAERIRRVDEVLRILQKTSNPVEKAEYIGLVSDRLGIRQQVLMERFPTLLSPSSRRIKEKTREPVQDLRSAVPKGNPEERDLVILLLHEKLDPQHIQQLQSHMFQEPAYRRIIEMALGHGGNEGSLDFEAFRAEVFNTEDLAPVIAHLTLRECPFDNTSDHAKGCLDVLKRKQLKVALDELIVKLRLAEQEQRKEDVDRLILEIDRLRDQKAMLVVS